MATIGMVTIDCANPQAQARFWTAALNTTVVYDHGAFVMLAPPADGAPAIGLQQVPEFKTSKTRAHMDLTAPDRRAEVARLVELGAKVLGEHKRPPGMVWTVLTDPEGVEFCVGQYTGEDQD